MCKTTVVYFITLTIKQIKHLLLLHIDFTLFISTVCICFPLHLPMMIWACQESSRMDISWVFYVCLLCLQFDFMGCVWFTFTVEKQSSGRMGEVVLSLCSRSQKSTVGFALLSLLLLPPDEASLHVCMHSLDYCHLVAAAGYCLWKQS